MIDLNLESVVRNAFLGALNHLHSEAAVMPLSRWNESVLRYYFCRCIATAHNEVEQLVECARIDLVLSRESQRAFVEFKFYRHAQRFDPYDGAVCGQKGGPSRKNLSEFQGCVDQLNERSSIDGLEKYVVLVYADPTDENPDKRRFSDNYDAYRHPRPEVDLRLLEASEPFATGDEVVQGRLFAVGSG